MDQSERFSELLKNHRRARGMKQVELAEKWGYSREAISAWERGKRVPNSQDIPKLAQMLSMKPEELVQSIEVVREQLEIRRNHVAEADDIDPEEIRPEVVDGENELLHAYRDRTEFSHYYSYPRLFENAHEILAIGISLNAIAIAYSTEHILKLIIEKACKITACFLDPEGVYCKEREREEGVRQGHISQLTGVNISSMETTLDLLGKLAPDYVSQLEIMTYDLPPRFNMYIIDDALMTVQAYGYGRGEDTPVLVLKRQSKQGLFAFYASVAHHIRMQAKIPGRKSS